MLEGLNMPPHCFRSWIQTGRQAQAYSMTELGRRCSSLRAAATCSFPRHKGGVLVWNMQRASLFGDMQRTSLSATVPCKNFLQGGLESRSSWIGISRGKCASVESVGRGQGACEAAESAAGSVPKGGDENSTARDSSSAAVATRISSRSSCGEEARSMGNESKSYESDSNNSSRRWLSERANSFGSSVIVEISRLAQDTNAINLAEGFPDFAAPGRIKQAAVAAINSDFNQYLYDASLCQLVARKAQQTTGVPVADDEVALACGQSGAMSAAMLAVLNPGDEVLLLDPAFEAYPAVIQMAGAIPVYIPLTPPNWGIDEATVRAAVTEKTKAIVINSPCNPTGAVFSRQQLGMLAGICHEFDLLAITDEVYEQFTYDSSCHVSIRSLPGMCERTIVTSSVSKTFSVTGWRIGWAIAPSPIAAAISTISAKLIDSPPAAFQEASKVALCSTTEYYTSLREDYIERRDFTVTMLRKMGLIVHQKPEGSIFVFAQLPDSYPLDDVAFCKVLIRKSGVAMVPGSIFFHEPSWTMARNMNDSINASGESQHRIQAVDRAYCSRYVRVAFCKDLATLQSAQKQLTACAVLK